MPEINEIRKYADFIKDKIKKNKILDINILNGRYKTHGPFQKYNAIKKELPLKLLDVKTKGKLLYLVFENNFYIFSTLGLYGGWCYLKEGSSKYNFSQTEEEWLYFDNLKENDSYYIKNALKHLNVEFRTSKGSLYYYDVLSFGSLKVIEGEEELNKKLKTIGPDIMESDTTFDVFKNQILKTRNLNKEIGIVIMNQKIISGIGNYLRADILYMSKISPFRKVNKLTEKELEAIYKNAKVLTWGDYDIKMAKKLKLISKETKLPRDYDRMFFVYSYEEDIHGNKIVKKELYEGSQKRFIYYVPSIQK
jgi:formamidopyrimidine-DNA glycosylase